MSHLFYKKSLISDVVGSELPDDQDQLMEISLSPRGVLTICMFSKSNEVLRSRIALRIKESKAVEIFGDDEAKFYQLRVDGSAVPVVFTRDEVALFMESVEKVI